MRLPELPGGQEYRVVEVVVPRPAPGEVLVKMAACGVCASELDAWSGRVPAEFRVRTGHEVTGTVVQLGPERQVLRWATAWRCGPPVRGKQSMSPPGGVLPGATAAAAARQLRTSDRRRRSIR